MSFPCSVKAHRDAQFPRCSHFCIAEEAALYDRQLRLWGSEAQSRIRQCRVLIAPFQGGLAIEVAKNLILAGVKEIVLLDDGIVDEAESLTAGFVWRKEDTSKVVSWSVHRRSWSHGAKLMGRTLPSRFASTLSCCTASRSCSPKIVVSEPSCHHHADCETTKSGLN